MTKTRDFKNIKSDEEIEFIRESSRVVAKTLELLGAMIRPGIMTGELDQAAEDFIRSNGGVPSFKGYRGFPASICASVNSEVVHGIPGSRVLKNGDIISIDVGVLKAGYHGDGAGTFGVGEITEEASRLLKTTKDALMAGIDEAAAGKLVRQVSAAIQKVIVDAGCSVVTDYTGHGIGQSMHEAPQIPNFVIPGDKNMLESGMTLAIEPMVNIGGGQVTTKADGWTVVTQDGSLSAHFEHTVAVREHGAEILTALQNCQSGR
jgi:methionyl aminopeptidase